jgi:integrase/recombinase XerD
MRPTESSIRGIRDHSDGGPSGQIVPVAVNTPAVAQQADSDERLVELWLHGRSQATQEAYGFDAKRLFRFLGKPLGQMTLGDLQSFADNLGQGGLAPASQHRVLAAVKSLFTFGCRLGYLRFDAARALRLPSLRNRLSARILDEGQVLRMIALEPHPRNQVMLLVLYGAGLRVSEACGLKWRDCQPRQEGGQVTVHGKGGKTRTILLPNSVWESLLGLQDGQGDDAPVFRSRKNGHLRKAAMERVVRKAAKRAGILRLVSPHWLRHAHASHALDRNAPIHVVQATLGHASLSSTSRYVHARPSDSSSRYLPL